LRLSMVANGKSRFGFLDLIFGLNVRVSLVDVSHLEAQRDILKILGTKMCCHDLGLIFLINLPMD